MLISKDDYPHVAGVLRKKNIEFETQLDDVQRAIDDQKIPTGRQHSFHSRYHNLFEVNLTVSTQSNRKIYASKPNGLLTRGT